MFDPKEKTDFDNPPGIFFHMLKHNSCVYDHWRIELRSKGLTKSHAKEVTFIEMNMCVCVKVGSMCIFYSKLIANDAKAKLQQLNEQISYLD